MSSVDEVRPDAFFPAVLLPLHRANLRRRIAYLQLERRGDSHWGPVRTRSGGFENVAKNAVSADDTLQRLNTLWVAENDSNLAKLAPYLIALRRALADSRPAPTNNPPLSDFAYPLF